MKLKLTFLIAALLTAFISQANADTYAVGDGKEIQTKTSWGDVATGTVVGGAIASTGNIPVALIVGGWLACSEGGCGITRHDPEFHTKDLNELTSKQRDAMQALLQIHAEEVCAKNGGKQVEWHQLPAYSDWIKTEHGAALLAKEGRGYESGTTTLKGYLDKPDSLDSHNATSSTVRGWAWLGASCTKDFAYNTSSARMRYSPVEIWAVANGVKVRALVAGTNYEEVITEYSWDTLTDAAKFKQQLNEKSAF